jgi:4-amino-4-deoxy-L-arabinose transferase-like glycosyltransferase
VVIDLVGPLDPSPYAPLTVFPPGYSLLIAAAMTFGLSGIEAARVVSLVSFGGLAAAAYWLARAAGSRVAAILACATTLVLPSTLTLGVMALSDGPFATLLVLSILAMAKWATSRKQDDARWLILSAICAGLSCLIRYYGMVLVVSGVIVILLSDRMSVSRRLLWGGCFSAVSLVPVAAWLIRNWVLNGYVSGMDRNGLHPSLDENIRLLVRTLAADLLPHFNLGLRSWLLATHSPERFGIILFVVATSVIVAARRPRSFGLDWHRPLSSQVTVAAILVLTICLYIMGLVYLSSTTLFPAPDWPRYVSPIYPVAIVLLVDLCAVSARAYSNNELRRGAIGMIVGIIVLVVPYGLETRTIVEQAADGLAGTYAWDKWRLNKGLAYLRSTLSQSDLVYSDTPYAVGLLLNRPARDLPLTNRPDQVLAWLDLPRAAGAKEYVIVFKGIIGWHPPYWRVPLSADEMAHLAATRSDVHVIADFSDATVYRLDDNPRDADAQRQ